MHVEQKLLINLFAFSRAGVYFIAVFLLPYVGKELLCCALNCGFFFFLPFASLINVSLLYICDSNKASEYRSILMTNRFSSSLP